MGDHYQVIVDLDATGEEAERLARRAVAWLVSEGIVLPPPGPHVPGRPAEHPPGPHWHRVADGEPDRAPTDGLTVHTGRAGFTSGADLPGAARCPACGTATGLDDGFWERFCDALRTWKEAGAAAVACPGCAVAVPVQEWTWDEAPLALGALGLEFRNWPDLGARFRARTAAVLDGHRTAYVWGKL
ncbi:hypothetical protein [Streptomyces sp. enrichment culture]|uniref:hypothetical protein n=1 Tax=Streptomyces sp. enrichment culture TaxID=1795815 RepID=UPI003F5763BC